MYRAERASPSRLAALEPVLRARAGIPVLVVRLPDLERIAWRRGLRRARRIERRAIETFAVAAARVLRADDRIAHDAGSDRFVAALVARTREGGEEVAPLDVRAALARIAATLESALRLDVLTGWTLHRGEADAGAIRAVVERALATGERERQRYTFFSALGHELRTPLSSIRGYLETLLDEEVDASTRRRFTGIAHREAIRLCRLVDGMFEISLLDLHADADRGAAWLARAVDAACDACHAAATARRATVTLGSLPRDLLAIGEDRLTLVLVNLIENAIKHGRPGGRVRIAGERVERRFVRLHVDDDGPGILAEDRERIFAVGERAGAQAPGSGLGLAFVRLMIERIGGRIDAASSPLGGARFTLAIPRAADETERP